MFGKIINAVVTPFNEDYSIDYDSFYKILKHLENTHIDSIIIGATTGEGSTLSINEKLNLIKFAKENLPKRIKVLVGIGTNNTIETIKQVKKFKGGMLLSNKKKRPTKPHKDVDESQVQTTK